MTQNSLKHPVYVLTMNFSDIPPTEYEDTDIDGIPHDTIKYCPPMRKNTHDANSGTH